MSRDRGTAKQRIDQGYGVVCDLGGRPIGDLIVAEVSDNGNGIRPSDFQKLFQPYFSTKGRGTGLGLAIVQRIVSEHHGRIKAVNNSPKGAKFIVELPVIG